MPLEQNREIPSHVVVPASSAMERASDPIDVVLATNIPRFERDEHFDLKKRLNPFGEFSFSGI